jgi:hypothetical protein
VGSAASPHLFGAVRGGPHAEVVVEAIREVGDALEATPNTRSRRWSRRAPRATARPARAAAGGSGQRGSHQISFLAAADAGGRGCAPRGGRARSTVKSSSPRFASIAELHLLEELRRSLESTVTGMACSVSALTAKRSRSRLPEGDQVVDLRAISSRQPRRASSGNRPPARAARPAGPLPRRVPSAGSTGMKSVSGSCLQRATQLVAVHAPAS